MSHSTDNYRKHTASNPLQKFLIGRFFNTLVKETEKIQPNTILDVGCGEGFTLEKFRLAGIGKELVGIDFSNDAINIGKKTHPDLKLQPGTIYHIPFKPSSFDLVVCTEVLEHLEFPEKALDQLEKVTKKYCIISVPHEPWFMLANFLRGKNLSRWGNDIEHINHWSRKGIAGLIRTKFDILEIRQPFPWTIIVAHKRKN